MDRTLRSGVIPRVRPVNYFLQALEPGDRARLEPALTRVKMPRDAIVADRGQTVRQAHLPIDCILSVITVMEDGRAIESRTIGRESGFGLLHALGSAYSYERVEVQVGGEAWRLPLDALTEAAAASPALTRAIVAHGQATIVQAALAIACNTLHSVEPRLCRWLLLTQDRRGSDVLPLSQEHLAIMLGVQRTTGTAAIGALQARKAIRTVRGRISILDRDEIEACACECYEAIEGGVARLIGKDLRV